MEEKSKFSVVTCLAVNDLFIYVFTSFTGF